MKNELKISTLSIVCVLCAAIAAPAFGASSVRSLGGAGTYSSASSAAAAKSNSTGNSTANSVRGGSMRMNNTSTSSSRLGTTRAATTPRLSIGKYLGGSTAVSGGSSIRPGESAGGNQGGSDVSGNLQNRIKVLEEFMGYSSTGDNIPEQLKDIQLDVDALAADLAVLTGAVTEVVYADGELTVTQDGKDTVFDLTKDFADKSEIEALQDAIDAIVIPNLDDYAKLTDLDGLLTGADLSDLEDAVEALELADESMDTAIKALQGGMVTKDVLDSKVDELTAADADLQAAIDALKNTMPSTEGLVNKDYVDNAVAGLEQADQALQNAIDAIVQPDVDKAYVDAAIADLNSAIVGLQSADSAMEQAIADLQARIANAATQDDIKDFVTSDYVANAIKDMATKSDIQDMVKSGELQAEIAKLATKEQIANFVTSDEVTQSIADATKDLLTADDVADFVKSGELTTAIANATNGLATKDELNTAKSELQAAIDKINAGDVDLTNYYTKADADSIFATKSEIPVVPMDISAFNNDSGYITGDALTDYAKTTDLSGVQDLVDANKDAIAENVADITALDSAVQAAASEAADAKLAAGTAQNMADLNAADIKELQEAGYITDAALAPYAKSENLAKVATSGSYDDLINQPTLITQDDLTALRTALESQINAKEDEGDYVTSEALKEVSDTLADLKDDSYTKAQIDQMIADAVTGGSIDLSGYATAAALNQVKADLEAKDTELSDGLTALTNSLTDYVKKSELSAVATSGSYNDLIDAPDMQQYVTNETLEEKKFLTEEVAQQTYLTESNVNEFVEIKDGSITAAKLAAGAVTADKIDTGTGNAGEMIMLMSNGDGTSEWVSVEVADNYE